MSRISRVFLNTLLGLLAGSAAAAPPQQCFLLQDLASADIVRGPADDCDERSAPASTFKIPHALAALDAGIVSAEQTVPYAGDMQGPPAWQRDHTLASALRHSVVWYFQRIAERMGAAREREYLRRFDYGNQAVGDDVTTFWLGSPLAISPLEQLAFLARLHRGELPIARELAATVEAALVQPAGEVWNARGAQPFAAPWPADATVAAKTGSTPGIRWLVGHVRRSGRSWIFVARVRADEARLPPNAAIDLAAEQLQRRGVL